MLNGGEGLPFEEHRLALPPTRGCAVGSEVVQLDVKEQQFARGLVGYLDPFAARRAIKFDVEGGCDRQGRAAQLEDSFLLARQLDVNDFKVGNAKEWLRHLAKGGGEIEGDLPFAGQGETVAGELVVE
jgi:hypothetical protein